MRVKNKKLRWVGSPNAAGYRLYWSRAGSAGYDSEHAELGNATQVVLPDDIPSFPVTTDPLEIAITAVGPNGNESDMARLKVRFERPALEELRLVRLRPGVEGWEPPVNAPVLIDGLNHWVIRNVSSNGSSTSHTTYYYFECGFSNPSPLGRVRDNLLCPWKWEGSKFEARNSNFETMSKRQCAKSETDRK